MLEIFAQISNLIKKRSVCIDNNVFTLHYRVTVILLTAFCLIIGSRKYFGDPIDCTALNTADPRIVDNYCWFNSYIVIPRHPDYAYDYRLERVHPVINKYRAEKLSNPAEKYKAYYLHAYQWIEFILFAQAIMFFLPRYLWRYCWEQERVKTLTQGFSLVSLKPEDNRDRNEGIVQYFRRNRLDHFEYAWKYIICEVLNFAIVMSQLVILQTTFTLDWETLGSDFLSSDSNINPHNPLNLVFPNLAKCEVPTVGGAEHDFLAQFCVLPVNVFITKIYIFLWFYFYALAVISGATLVYRIATLFSVRLRMFVFKRVGKHLPDECVRVVRDLSYGDWFLLCLVGKNMDPFSFQELVRGFGDAILASSPSFALVGVGSELYNPELAAVHMKKESVKTIS